MDHIKKRLIFYFYVFDGFKDNRAIKIHLKCLNLYRKIFDEALFVISIDDTSNENLIMEAEKEIMNCGFLNVSFKVHKNNYYCESEPFYEEVIKKIDTLDGLTFFGHTKGVTNYTKFGTDNSDSIDNWIIGLYYLNLTYIDEVESYMCRDLDRFYGAFLENTNGKAVLNKYEVCYAGTFYWINCPMLQNDIEDGNIKIPNTYHNRCLAETFPGNLFSWESDYLGSHLKKILYPYDEYKKTNETVMNFLLGDDNVKYFDFKNEILKDII